MTGRREAAACYTTVSDQLNFQLLLIENKHAYPSTVSLSRHTLCLLENFHFFEYCSHRCSARQLSSSIRPLIPSPFLFHSEARGPLQKTRRRVFGLPILTLYHRLVPGDVTSRANSRGSYGNGAANTKPKSIRCTRQHIARGARGALSC